MARSLSVLVTLLGLFALLDPLAMGAHPAAQGTPVGFLEDFALAEDRAALLERLVPGTDDHFYYSSLVRQAEGNLDEADRLLQRWKKRGNTGGMYEQIETRQALLRVSTDPDRTYRYLERELGLRFTDRRRVRGESPNLPTELDPGAIDTERLLTALLKRRRSRDIRGIEPTLFESLVRRDLSKEQIGDLLDRLPRADVPGLVSLILKDMEAHEGQRFGKRAIHSQLLLDQLEALRAARPKLLSEEAYVTAVLDRLAIGPDASLDDPATELAYLERVWGFVQTLPEAFNSLKAHVLYHRLVHDLDHAQPNADRLLQYLRLPRRMSYFPRRSDRRLTFANERDSFDCTPFPSIGNEEPIVVEMLQSLFASGTSIEVFRDAIEKRFLQRVWAESQLLNGKESNPEALLEMLGGAASVETLRERVEIQFARSNRERYGANDPVVLDVDIKNVDTLLVKVFEVDPLAYFDRYGRSVRATIDLDGLVANYEETASYDAPPLRRVRRTFALDRLTGPGTYIVELIGGGVSSRAVVRKGSLHLIERIGAAGHAFRVLDDDRAPVDGATLRFGGRDFAPDERGEVLIPFTTAPGQKSVLMRSEGVASVATFRHLGEAYALEAGIHTPRESLLAGMDATFLVRPQLTLNGQPIALEVLENPVLEIRARTLDGTDSSIVVDDLKLRGADALTAEIRVPERAQAFQVTLRGSVQGLTDGDDIQLASTVRTFQVNGLQPMQIRQALLTRTEDGYAVDVVGRNGEPCVDVPTRVRMKHSGFSDQISRELKTDERGRVRLGRLANIDQIVIAPVGDPTVTYDLTQPGVFGVKQQLHIKAGEPLRVPYSGAATSATRAVASLIRHVDGTPVADHFDALAVENRYVVARGLAAGDYWLTLEETGATHLVRVADGAVEAGHVVDEYRALELTRPVPLQIVSVDAADEALVVQLGGASHLTRVHVFVSRTIDLFDAQRGLALGATSGGGVSQLVPVRTTYESGREISDEYRYILDRRLIDPYPGNMLRRPGYLLNPWVVGETVDEMMDAGSAGGAYRGPSDAAPPSSSARSRRLQQRGGPTASSTQTLDFLRDSAAILDGLKPDAQGRVTIPLAALGNGHLIRVVATDDLYTAAQDVTRTERPWDVRDRRLIGSLDPASPMTQQRRIAFVQAGEDIVIRDAPNAGAQTFETLADVFSLYRTMGGGGALDPFEFLTRWPSLTDEEKLEEYSGAVCHEVHAFLREKDPAFFNAIVRPYLENKGHRTFMDDWLLGADLAPYLAPARFARLNVVEQILLLRDTDGDPARLADDLYELVPRGTFSLDQAFAVVLASGSLSAKDKGLATALEATKKEARKTRSLLMAETATRTRSGPATPGPGRQAADAPVAANESSDDFFLGRAAEEEVAAMEDTEALTGLRELGYAGGREEQERMGRDAVRRKRVAGRFYRDLAPTLEYAETHYWKVRLAQTNGSLVTVSPFWVDFARADSTFASSSFPMATRSVNEMLLALAFLDLPFEANEHKVAAEGRSVRMSAASPMFLALEDIAEAAPEPNAPAILVGQNFFRHDQRTMEVDGVEVERFVRDEFLVGVPYGCRFVVTNPTPRGVELQALVQIPEGAIALEKTHVTKGHPLAISSYGTNSFEVLFYFPEPGTFRDYPIHVGRGAALLAAAEAVTLRVLTEPSTVDRKTWDWISQNAELPALLDYLNEENPRELDLGLIAWRMKDAAAFGAVTESLAKRNVLHPKLWSYGVRHRDEARTREFLQSNDRLPAAVGMRFASPLYTLDPRERALYEHLAYEPLVNGRTHEFGGERRILNQQFADQYRRFLLTLSLGAPPSGDERMEVAYYLLLQDRVREALAVFDRIDAGAIRTSLQHDYMRAYMAFYRGDVEGARAVASPYAEHPVARWRARFQEVLAQADEAQGRGAEREVDPEDRDGSQGALAGAEPLLTLKVEDGEIRLTHERIETIEVRYHRMDVEFLFSNSPFVRGGEGSFGLVAPNRVDVVTLDPNGSATVLALPAELQSANVAVEVRGGGMSRRTTYFAGDLTVQGMERFGQLRVLAGAEPVPLSRAYVKVYARLADGSVRFHKDGYTDLRGRFDYVSLSGVSGPAPQRFAVLVMHEDRGATISELSPPAR